MNELPDGTIEKPAGDSEEDLPISSISENNKENEEDKKNLKDFENALNQYPEVYDRQAIIKIYNKFNSLLYQDKAKELAQGKDVLPMPNPKKISEMSLQSMMEDLLEAKKKKPSAGLTKKQKSNIVKKAKAGKDMGKKGKGFEKIVKAAEKSGARDPQAVAGAAFWKGQAKKAK